MIEIESDIVIVGSGAGGAAAAWQLADSGKKIIILEKGSEAGRYLHYNKGYSAQLPLGRSGIKCGGKKILKKPVGMISMLGIGGTTLVGTANLVRSLEKELGILDVDIQSELEEIESELHVRPYPSNRLGKGAKKLWEAGAALGHKWEFMPRAVDFKKCRFCGLCTFECRYDSKWTALRFLHRAQEKGILLKRAAATEVLTSNGRAAGVKGRSGREKVTVKAETVILAAGAVETALILQNSGIDKAGGRLFCDPYFVMYDSGNDSAYWKEPQSLIIREFVRDKGFMYANSTITRFERLYKYAPKFLKPGKISGMLGIMIKIKDDASGKVHRDGTVEKVLTPEDIAKLKASIPLAEKILVQTGARIKNIKLKSFAGVHPGGTAAIGQVVDQNLETEIKNCYAADASVLPEAPGLPPMLTIMALSKRLGKGIKAK